MSEEERKAIKQSKKCISNRCEKCKYNDNGEVCIAIHDTSIQTVKSGKLTRKNHTINGRTYI